MLIEQAIFNHLSTDAGVAALVGTRVYPVMLPQGATLPAVTYMRVSSTRMRTFGAPRMGRVARFQFTVWATTYLSRGAIVAALIDALEGYSGTLGGVGGVDVLAIQQEGQLDDYEPTAKVFQSACDFFITHLGD